MTFTNTDCALNKVMWHETRVFKVQLNIYNHVCHDVYHHVLRQVGASHVRPIRPTISREIRK